MRLKEIRAEKKITTIELGKRLGVVPSTITNWEKGLRKPDVDMLVRLTEVFNCTADELLGIERKKPDPEDEKPETRGQEISVRMSEALADARKRQEA